MRHGIATALAAALLLLHTSTATAQFEPPVLTDVPLHIDSGELRSSNVNRSAVFSKLLHVPGAATMRLHFADLKFGQATGDVLETELRITALHDGAQQILNVESARQWGWSSAWFNGDTVHVELIADASASPSRIRIDSATVALAQPETDGSRTICGADDDRLLSTDPRVGRVISNGCTAWLINDANHCLLSAGHCTGSGFDVIEFNYPISNTQGIWQHAHPDDQYVIDPASLQAVNGGTGNDWAYFGCFANPQTTLTPYEAQGAAFTLAAIAPPGDERTIRITGNGTTNAMVPLEFYRAQKTHTGELIASVGSTLSYDVDTTGGNSGSPVIDETTGEAIGIHTHGGCTSNGGANVGTASINAGLLTALANPLGVCAPPIPTLEFTFPGGVPTLLNPAGDSITVQVVGLFGGTLDAGSVVLQFDSGTGFTALPMVQIGANLFQANTPPLPCGTVASLYVSGSVVSKEKGSMTITEPATAPAQVIKATAAQFLDTAFADNGEVDLGWSVVNVLPLDGGAWDRGVPAGGGDRGDPRIDFDGSGSCWLTENANGDSDIDGGPTRLISPLIDLSSFDDPILNYARWFFTDTPGGGFEFDHMEIELSDDSGQSWQPVDFISQPTQWVEKSIRVADFVSLTPTVQLRFSAVDAATPSIVECGVDAIRIFDVECTPPTLGDVNLDGAINVFDLLIVLNNWGNCDAPCPPSCQADITNALGTGTDCTVDAFDLLLLLSNWGG